VTVVSRFVVNMIRTALTVLAGDGSKIKDIDLAALCDSAAAKSRVGLGDNDGSAGGESEEGSGELHGDCCWIVCLVCLCGVVWSKYV